MRLVVSIIIALLLSSCGSSFGKILRSHDSGGSGKASVLRDGNLLPGTKVVDLQISKTKLKSAIEQGGTHPGIRIVRIHSRTGEAGAAHPQYRLFSISKGSPYDLLKLQNGDVLVAASDYVVQDPRRFPMYVSLLPNEDQAQIEIRRAGIPVLFRYSFME